MNHSPPGWASRALSTPAARSRLSQPTQRRSGGGRQRRARRATERRGKPMHQSVAPSEIAIAGARPSCAGSTEGSATGAALVAAFSAAALAESSQLCSLSGAGGQNRSKVSSTAATLTRTRSDHGGLKYLDPAASQAFRANMSTDGNCRRRSATETALPAVGQDQPHVDLEIFVRCVGTSSPCALARDELQGQPRARL